MTEGRFILHQTMHRRDDWQPKQNGDAITRYNKEAAEKAKQRRIAERVRVAALIIAHDGVDSELLDMLDIRDAAPKVEVAA